MTIAFEKAFKEGPTAVSRASWGNLYKTLSGSYFRGGNYAAFFRTALKSLIYQPGNIMYFIKFPLRRLGASSQEAR